MFYTFYFGLSELSNCTRTTYKTHVKILIIKLKIRILKPFSK